MTVASSAGLVRGGPSSLSVLIVNWNRRAELQLLFEDIRCQTEPPDQIVVVDNGSTDGAAEMVAGMHGFATLIRLPVNRGLSFGRNVGIAAVTGELVCILDNDLRILDRTFFARVRNSAETHRDAGIISFEQIVGLWAEQSETDRPFAWADLLSSAARGEYPCGSDLIREWFFWGGASVIRRAVFEKVGLFDEMFGYGGEEWDFAYRCHALELILIRDKSLWVIHTQSPQMRAKTARSLILRNMVVAQSRYLPLIDLGVFLIMQFLTSAVRAVRQRTVPELMRTVASIIKGWPAEVARKRRPIERTIMRRVYYLRASERRYEHRGNPAEMGVISYYRRRTSRKTVPPPRVAMFPTGEGT